MKKLILILGFALIAGFAAAQTTAITIASNPREINPDNTGVITLTFNTRHRKAVSIYFPSANGGTVQVNTMSSTVTSSPAYAAGQTVHVSVTDTLYIKFSADTDVAWISWID